jgi:hypothetical protein
MRIDARAGDTGWCVFHVPQAGVLKYVIWVDDETAMWCEFAHPLRLDRATGSAATITHQAKAIRIIPADRRRDDEQMEDGPGRADGPNDSRY